MNGEEEFGQEPSLNVLQHTHQQSALELQINLQLFVTKFVKEFEAKLHLYSSILDGATPKSGKYADLLAEIIGQGLGLGLGGALGFVVGHPGTGASAGKKVVGAISKSIGNKLGQEHHKKKISKLSELIYFYEQNKSEFRRILAKVGLDIFQSFEMQFGRVRNELGERGALNQLAIDAMNRAIDYISKTSVESQMDHHSLILKGVKSGNSKETDTLVPGRRKGFEIYFKQPVLEVKWKTASLYSKVGIVIIDGQSTTYYQLKAQKNKKNKTAKYGFRRCFTSEKWEEIKSDYSKTDLSNSNGLFLDYKYYYNPDIVTSKFDDICEKLEADDDKLDVKRIKSLLKESSDEALKNLQKLIPISEIESRILSKVEACLNDLNLEEKFESEIESCEELLVQFGHLKIGLEDIAFGSPIWFDVRPQLKVFVGRVAILDQIERELNSGSVLICGLGGIGKSELVAKYARTRYDIAANNVIWVNAENEESIAGSIWQLAQVLKVNDKDSYGKKKDLDLMILDVYKIIFHQKCLLILDNAKQLSDIELLLRLISDVVKCQPKVIITSRNSSEWESLRFSIKPIHLEVLARAEAIEFIKESLSLEDDLSYYNIDKLIDALGNFPLPLQHAVANIKKNSRNTKKSKQNAIANFLKKFADEPENLLGENLPLDTYRKETFSIFKIVSLTLKELKLKNKHLGEKAQFVLKMASYMAPNNIREDFFEDDLKDELISVMNLLESYSLVKIDDEKLIIHRLVQQAIRLESKAEEENILKINLDFFLKKFNKWDSVAFCIPHVISIWEFACDYEKLIEEFIVKTSYKFNVYNSFFQTLVEKNKLDIVKKIIDKIKISYNSNKLSDIMGKLFDEKTVYLGDNPEMLKLFKENGIEVDNKAMSMVVKNRKSIHISMSQPISVSQDFDYHSMNARYAQSLPVDLQNTNYCTIL